MKKLLAICLFLLPFYASGNETYVDKISGELVSLVHTSVDEMPVSEKIKVLDSMELEINEKLTMENKNPQLCWVLGRVIYVYRLVIPDLYSNDRYRWNEVMNKTVEAYRNAVKYTINNEPKLTDDMLYQQVDFGEPSLSIAAGDLLFIKIKDGTYHGHYKDAIIDVIDMITTALVALGRYDEIPKYRAILPPCMIKNSLILEIIILMS
jgi:hypothetical protein